MQNNYIHIYIFIISFYLFIFKYFSVAGIGEWGLGIGPIPNLQSPINEFLELSYFNQ